MTTTTLSRPGLLPTIAAGVRAGAAGTTVLNLVTYADMAARGRQSSSAPAQLVSHVTDALGIPLGQGKHAEARSQGWGALLGIGSGIATGVIGSVLVQRRGPRRLVLAAMLGAGAMIASDLPLVAAGVTNPAEWRMSGWLSDIVPHAAYGVATAIALS